MRRILDLYRSSFTGLPRRIWQLCLVTFVNRTGTMVLPFLSLYLTQERGASVAASGLVLGAYGVGSMMGALLGGQLADRIGPWRTQGLALLGQGAGFIVLAQLESEWSIGLVLFVTALVGDCFRPASMAAIVEAAPPELRARAFALLRLAINVGMTFGPAVGGVLAVRDYRLLFWVDAATCWAAALLVWRLVDDEVERIRQKSAAVASAGRRIPRDGPLLELAVLSFVMAVCFFQLLSTVPLYYRQGFGLREDQIGLLLALNTLIIIGFEMVLVRLLEQGSAARVAGVGCLFIGGGFALMPLGEGVPFLAFTVVVWTVGEMLALPFSNSLAGTRAASGRSGRTMGIYMLAFALASTVAPILGMAVYDRFGPEALWGGVGVVSLFLWLGFSHLASRIATETNA